MASDSGEGHGWEGGEDDWFAEKDELDWLDDPRERPAASSCPRSPGLEQGADAGAQRGWDAGPEGAERDSRQPTRALVVRRRAVGLVAVGLVVAAVIAVVIATSGGGGSTGGRAPVGTPGPTASAPQRTSKRTIGTVSSPTPPTSTPAKVTLPSN